MRNFRLRTTEDSSFARTSQAPTLLSLIKSQIRFLRKENYEVILSTFREVRLKMII
jgi:hypothetical protein